MILAGAEFFTRALLRAQIVSSDKYLMILQHCLSSFRKNYAERNRDQRFLVAPPPQTKSHRPHGPHTKQFTPRFRITLELTALRVTNTTTAAAAAAAAAATVTAAAATATATTTATSIVNTSIATIGTATASNTIATTATTTTATELYKTTVK